MATVPPRRSRASERSTGAEKHQEDVIHAFLFRQAEGRQYGLSIDPNGRFLPRDFPDVSAWVFIRPIDVVAGESRVEFDSEDVFRSLHRDGYALIGHMAAR